LFAITGCNKVDGLIPRRHFESFESDR
jgi:hypothetical protein